MNKRRSYHKSDQLIMIVAKKKQLLFERSSLFSRLCRQSDSCFPSRSSEQVIWHEKKIQFKAFIVLLCCSFPSWARKFSRACHHINFYILPIFSMQQLSERHIVSELKQISHPSSFMRQLAANATIYEKGTQCGCRQIWNSFASNCAQNRQ